MVKYACIRVTLALAIACATGCAPPDKKPSSVVGALENKIIDEASGLAVSQEHADTLWVINDDGPAMLHAISSTGKDRGSVRLTGARNRDWEDLASFRMHDATYLLVADTGDNDSRRNDVRLYVLPEPAPGTAIVRNVRRIDFRYPDGPRDAEAVAVDVENNRALILSKRDIPAVLYSVSLAASADEQQTAIRLGEVTSLPQPNRNDIGSAAIKDDGYWQPTAMDISSDGSAAVVLTYAGVFLYRRAQGESWLDALQRQPAIVSRTRNKNAESIAFNLAGDTVYITLERRNAPLFRLELTGKKKANPKVGL